MSKFQSIAGTNNSATSSESSEAQSVEEQQAALALHNRSVALSRAKNSWKRMKELAAEKEKETEAKRPPWRAVSVSTLSKPDKNALLRAKLLDASRRLRAGKANVALQTDIVPTKLMKEKSLGAQSDLILYKEIGILTDGQYSKKKDGYQQYVLTYSMSQMTDTIEQSTRSTQTLLPKAYNDSVVNSYIPEVDDEGNVLLSDVEKRVADQIEKIRKFYVKEEDTKSPSRPPSGSATCPTIDAWHFEDDAIEMDSQRPFIPYTIEPYKPWRSFVPFPFRLRGNSLIGTQKIDWYALLQSIDDLIKESNSLVDKLERIMHEKNSHRKTVPSNLNKLPNFESFKFNPPSDHWLPIIEEQEKQLQSMMAECEQSANI
ncbi:uncharacterized protein Dwil_GK13392 [Drosophila willistoni]|uniref:Uncharacterized protein n=1 Tax=Drosophila willistoni TaxID=7260 RepID=B4NJY0_DROWI|nr:uncharacterized protein LOC6651730 [Drosophila willistoni]EDW83982.2 uncharacterized protein Dwil_GK13392 [Drosophila willistoni]